jgi:hypothetical protein
VSDHPILTRLSGPATNRKWINLAIHQMLIATISMIVENDQAVNLQIIGEAVKESK